MSTVGEVYTIPKELDLVVEWRIRRFLLLSSDQLYSSPQFSFNAHTWCLGICKKGDSYELFHKRSSVGPAISQEFSIALKTRNGQEMYEMHCADDFRTGIYYKLSQTIKKYDFLKIYKELIPSGVLTVVCTMKMPASGRSASKSCIQC